MDTGRKQFALRIERDLYLAARFESVKRDESFNKWVNEAIRQRLERDLLSKD
jgi:predicted HicB family RNase H-like nuclease